MTSTKIISDNLADIKIKFNVFLDAAGKASGYLYLDDTVTFGHKNGEYMLLRVLAN